MITKVLHFDKETTTITRGVETTATTVEEMKIQLRLPTPQAREAFRVMRAPFLKEFEQLEKTATAYDEEKLELTQMHQESLAARKLGGAGYLGHDERESRIAELDKLIEEYTLDVQSVSDRSTFASLRASVIPELRAVLTDEFLQCANLEEVREIVTFFRKSLGI